jgi:flagellar assembly protein FliH
MRNSLSEAAAPRRVEPFIYLEPGGPAEEPPLPAGTLTEAEAQERERRARREARQELERGLGADLEHRVEVERTAVAAALAAFERQRQDYFAQLEHEVVQLVLGIARKILHREAQLDPLLLTGTVRVALEQLAASAEVELHVPLSKMAQWEALLARGDFRSALRLRSDPALEPAGCRIETSTGSTDLSLEAQLREIEQGFLDLLARRTALAAAPPS